MAKRLPVSLGLLLFLSFCGSPLQAYKDVVFLHGLLAGAWEFDYFTDLIHKHHPGTKVYAVDMYSELSSIIGLWQQEIKSVHQRSEAIFKKLKSGIISRGILASVKHNVETFISLSAPLAGQFGDTDYLRFFFPLFIKDNIYRFFYTEEGQDTSVGNYWLDPHHQELYRNYSVYLGFLNNETVFINPQSEEYRQNFLRLKNLVLVGGPDDGVITPWQSSHFGAFDEKEVVQPMRKQKWYLNDAFGLKTLDQAGAIHMYTEPNVTHHFWHVKEKIFNKYILPWL
ncbi:lysosomal thioesterase ppt2-like protein [Plakobranchus ocellatus]|uniref:palmitoyl-CoA hydrolase n=1 Tax=Plakobranchus ocellatus TaxID=259542 RepID=A0AAV4DYW8_9GAST|nr:lysosomal thioesterase ppt2-like protein [Plakobranchus ocellatus]